MLFLGTDYTDYNPCNPCLIYIRLFQIKFEIEAVAIGFFLLWLWFRRILQVALLVKHIVCSAKYDELGAAVQLIADFLMLISVSFLAVIFCPGGVPIAPVHSVYNAMKCVNSQ